MRPSDLPSAPPAKPPASGATSWLGVVGGLGLLLAASACAPKGGPREGGPSPATATVSVGAIAPPPTGAPDLGSPTLTRAGGSSRKRHAIPRLRTLLPSRELLKALARGHLEAFGQEATDLRLAGAYALSAFETNSGQALYNYNFGNIVAASSEVRHALWPVVTATGESVEAMRAYEDPTEGAAGFWSVLSKHHGSALAAFDRGDTQAAVGALESAGYFRAPAARYAESLPRLTQVALALLPVLRLEAKRQGVPLTSLPIESTVALLDPSLPLTENAP